MQWFYVENGRQAGPVEEDALRRMAGQGSIDGTTLVWREGMAEWTPFAQAVGSPGGNDSCKACGRTFLSSDLVSQNGALFCKACRTGLAPMPLPSAGATAEMRYAGFWIRFVASFIDGILLSMVSFTISFVISFGANLALMSVSSNPVVPMAISVFTSMLGIAIGAGYEMFFVGRMAATPGKLACGIQIVRADGSRVTYARALGRHFAEWISSFTLMIGYIIAAFDEQKRTLHDHICDTRVVYK